MKKLLLAMMAASLAFTGCLKEDPNMAAQRKVFPGIQIFSMTAKQLDYTMQPANVGMRVAVLLAEAEKQGEADLDKLEVETDKGKMTAVKALFGSSVKIAKLENDDYTVTFTPETGQTGTVAEGVMTIQTHGKNLSETTETEFWSVTSGDKFTFKSYYQGTTNTTTITGGETIMYARLDGSIVIIPRNVRFGNNQSNFEAIWSGVGSLSGDYSGLGFLLTPPSKGLAYSDCRGEIFKMSGAAGGPTFNSLDGLSATKMMYEVANGKYIGGRIVAGNVVCRLTGGMDYDQKQFPSDFVLVDYVFNETTMYYSTKITYNGHQYPR